MSFIERNVVFRASQMNRSDQQFVTGDTAPPPGRSQANRLALLYQGLLTAVVRVCSKRQRIAEAEAFRTRTKAALQDVERDAIAAGYDTNDIKETHFAVVAFLDSVIFRSEEPIREDWERRPLQEELFGHAHAGDVFFEKLTRLLERRDSPELADVLEVYLLCLLLGFQGRYAGNASGHADAIAETLRRRIEHIRGARPSLWPSGATPKLFQTAGGVAVKSDRRLAYAMLAAAGAALLIFTVLKTNLVWTAGHLRFGFM